MVATGSMTLRKRLRFAWTKVRISYRLWCLRRKHAKTQKAWAKMPQPRYDDVYYEGLPLE